VHSLCTACIVGVDIGILFAYRWEHILAGGHGRAVIAHV